MPESRYVICPIHGGEHEYTDREVLKLLLFMQLEDLEDGPRCLRDLLDEDPDANPLDSILVPHDWPGGKPETW